MATLDWPDLPGFKPVRLAFGASAPKSRFAGFYSAQSQVVSHMADRLRLDITLPPCTLQQAAAREAFVMQLASSGDLVRLGHFLRPAPAGNLRGSPVLYEDALAGARSIRIQGAGTTVNLLGEPAAQDAATWLPLNSGTVTPNVAARPSGSSVTADQITDSSTSVLRGIEQRVGVADDAQTYTASIYVKATTGGTSKTFAFQLQFINGTTVTNSLRINTDTGAVLSGTGTVESAGSGAWWRLIQTVSNNASGNTTARFQLYPAIAAHGLSATDPTQTGSAIVWGAQLQLGSSASSVSFASLAGGDMLAVGQQLLPVGYLDVPGTSGAFLTVPLALPARRALVAGEPVVWDRPVGTFELLSDVSQVEYLPGRYQSALSLSFQEVL